MIQCGDYNWEILKENDGSDVYRLILSHEKNSQITLLYGEGNFTVRESRAMYGDGGPYFCFKIPFEQTPLFVKALIDGEQSYLMPIYHKDTVKIKKVKV
jgi:hypothetical protein